MFWPPFRFDAPNEGLRNENSEMVHVNKKSVYKNKQFVSFMIVILN